MLPLAIIAMSKIPSVSAAKHRRIPWLLVAAGLIVAAWPITPAQAGEERSAAYMKYYRGHLLRMTRDAYRKGQVLPASQIIPQRQAAIQLRASSKAYATATWIGHASFLVRLGNTTILTDPVYSSHPSPLAPAGPRRMAPPGLRFGDLPRIHAIVLSHAHYDHTGFPTLRRLAARDKRTVVLAPPKFRPLLSQAGFTRIIVLQPDGKAKVGNVRFTAVKVPHISGRDIDGDDYPHAFGWRMEAPRYRLFFAGDTSYGPQFRRSRRRQGRVNAALVPIGAYAPRRFEKVNHVNPEEALRIARDMGASLAIAMHWGTFALTPEPIMEPKQRFLAARGGPRRVVPKIGETIILKR